MRIMASFLRSSRESVVAGAILLLPPQLYLRESSEVAPFMRFIFLRPACEAVRLGALEDAAARDGSCEGGFESSSSIVFQLAV